MKRRVNYIRKFKLTRDQRRNLRESLLDQLDRCKTDACRRLLLGVSQKR